MTWLSFTAIIAGGVYAVKTFGDLLPYPKVISWYLVALVYITVVFGAGLWLVLKLRA